MESFGGENVLWQDNEIQSEIQGKHRLKTTTPYQTGPMTTNPRQDSPEHREAIATDCWFLAGPTASGKTTIAVELASRIGAEIISLDSMALFRGMDIGTAKPSPQQRRQTPHHLIDILDPCEDFSLSDYISAAEKQVDEVRAAGREVLFVGGTPLYLKSLLRGIYHGPPPDWDFRQQIEDELKTVDSDALHQRLEQVDPLSAAKLHPNDKRRIIRALEVYKLTGEPISHQQTHFEDGRSPGECKVFVLGWPRAVLHRRIEARVEAMFAAGLVDEVRGLLAQHGQLSRTASQAVGYREVVEHLQGQRDLDETIDLVKTHTRQFARRQEIWFRALSECRRIEMEEGFEPAAVAETIAVAGLGEE